MNDSFRWSVDFETGLPDIDDQHRHLVDLINRFGGIVMEGRVNAVDLDLLFRELADYTHYHFDDEEKLMERAGIHQDFIASHKNIHRGFGEHLAQLRRQMRADSPDDWESLLEFLYAWLIYHILGHDKDIAAQIELIGKGETAADAMAIVDERSNKVQIQPLMQALNNLVDMLTERNIQLDELNRTLEQKVQQRTRELQEANNQLEALSLTDSLTLLPNRRHALRKLESLWSEVDTSAKSLGCLMIDADYFKEVNDDFGHEAGDQVLKKLARTLQENIRNDDFLARLGGDEFLVLCPDTGLDGLLELSAKLLERVGGIDTRSGGKRLWRSSVSIGAAVKSAATNDITALLKIADESLYRAKEAGRGCVRSLQSD